MPTMNFKRRLPIPQEIREEMPLAPELAEAKQAFDAEVAAVITGASSKKLLIIGPCSADREDSVLEYVTRLAKVRDEVSEKLIIIPRVYTNKPRTKGTGYKGLLHQPNPEGGTDLLAGIKAIRHMHLRVIEETGMFTADEMLYPDNYRFLFDLLAYVAIGARSVENQDHRQVASGVEVPVGMKNPTGGSTPSCSTPSTRRSKARTSSTATGTSPRRAIRSRTRSCAAIADSTTSCTPTTTTSTWSVWPTST